jgi:hypothetical protein
MATVVRSESTGSGGLLVWVAEDPDLPIFFADGVQGDLDAVLAARQEAADKDGLLNKIRGARAMIRAKLDGLFEDARLYIEDNPGVTGTQLKDAFVTQIKAWFAAWTGD